MQRDFETLKLRYEELLRLFELLRTASDDAARQTLGKIRRGRSAKDVLQEAEAYDLPRSPSPLPVTGSILNLPETSIELEMVVRYPKVYTPILPLDPSAVDLGLLGLEFARSMRPHERVWEATHHLATGSALPLSTSLDPAQLMRSGEGEGTAPSQEHWRNNVYDERLRRLDISYWTKVPVSDDFAAGAINIYLTYEYPILGLFDADAFLDDLCEQKHLFCSSLLVNSLLAWMCVSSDETPIYAKCQASVLRLRNEGSVSLVHWRASRLGIALFFRCLILLYYLAWLFLQRPFGRKPCRAFLQRSDAPVGREQPGGYTSDYFGGYFLKSRKQQSWQRCGWYEISPR